MSNSLNLNSLVDYLKWRDQKRVEYKELSLDLRKLKLKVRTTMSEGGYAGNEQGRLIFLKLKATQIMEERRAAKQIARDSWSVWKQAERQAA